jgi:hypothetical protein
MNPSLMSRCMTKIGIVLPNLFCAPFIIVLSIVPLRTDHLLDFSSFILLFSVNNDLEYNLRVID